VSAARTGTLYRMMSGLFLFAVIAAVVDWSVFRCA
jgi:hypothetical protein